MTALELGHRLEGDGPALVLLPSSLELLVTTRRRGAPFVVENCSAVRTER